MESDERLCPKCAEPVKHLAVVCKHCGASLDVTANPTIAKDDAKRRRVRNGIIGVGAAIVGLFILGSVSGQPPKATNQSGQQQSPSESTPPAVSESAGAEVDASTQKRDLLKLTSDITTPMGACAEATDRVLGEMKRMQRGRSDPLTVYSAAQAAMAVCRNSSGQFENIKAPASLPEENRTAIDKAISEGCSLYPSLMALAWDKFSKLVDEDGHTLSGQYDLKSAVEEANAAKFACLGPIIVKLTQLNVSEKELKDASHGM